MMNGKPKWTVHYNIDGDYIGRGWEFFDDEQTAKRRFDELHIDEKYYPSMRPFHEKCDRPHMGAVHR